MGQARWREGTKHKCSFIRENDTTLNAKGLLSGGAFSSLGLCCLALLATFALPAGANSSPVLTPFFTLLAGWCICGLGCVTLFFWHRGDEKAKCAPWGTFNATPKLEKHICSLSPEEFGWKKVISKLPLQSQAWSFSLFLHAKSAFSFLAITLHSLDLWLILKLLFWSIKEIPFKSKW